MNYESLLEQIRKAEGKVVETKQGWRDYLSKVKMDRRRWGLTAFIVGSFVSIISGKVFLNRFINILERAAESQRISYDNLDSYLDRTNNPEIIEYDSIMDYSAIVTVLETTLAAWRARGYIYEPLSEVVTKSRTLV